MAPGVYGRGRRTVAGAGGGCAGAQQRASAGLSLTPLGRASAKPVWRADLFVLCVVVIEVKLEVEVERKGYNHLMLLIKVVLLFAPGLFASFRLAC